MSLGGASTTFTVSEPAPIGEAQTALHAIRCARSLMACEGWQRLLLPHLVALREDCATRILDDDSLADGEREKARVAYKVLRDLIRWPAETEAAQRAVLEASGGADEPV